MLFFRQLVHLLPDAAAWRVTVQKTLRRFLLGLTQFPADAREFIDAVYADHFSESTRELALWEEQFGLTEAATEDARRLQIAGAWAAQGGQSPRYLQDTVRAAGFDVYLHEWWLLPATVPRVARNPLTYTAQPKIGSVQCGDDLAHCTSPSAPVPLVLPVGAELEDIYPQCNRWLANPDDIHYLVNLMLTRDAPPPVPEDPARWPYFLYFSSATIGTKAQVPAARREEFERLLLKIRPAQQWIVTYVDYV
jgi:hypothetical protein